MVRPALLLLRWDIKLRHLVSHELHRPPSDNRELQSLIFTELGFGGLFGIGVFLMESHRFLGAWVCIAVGLTGFGARLAVAAFRWKAWSVLIILAGVYFGASYLLSVVEQNEVEYCAESVSKDAAASRVLVVTPTQVIFGNISSRQQNILNDQYTFTIENQRGFYLYAVMVKLRVYSSDASVNDFSLEVPKSSWKPIDENDPVGSEFADMGGLNCTDSSNRLVFWRYILRLGPHESRQVIMTHINTRESHPTGGVLPNHIGVPDIRDGIQVRAETPTFSTKELPIYKRGNTIGSPIFFDEPFKCDGLTFIKIR
jgi:hypothetical protein